MQFQNRGWCNHGPHDWSFRMSALEETLEVIRSNLSPSQMRKYRLREVKFSGIGGKCTAWAV